MVEYCCKELKNSESVTKDCYIKPDDPSYREYPGTWSVNGQFMNEKIKFCPFCGVKLA